MEQVGTLGSRPDDVLILKDCDTGVKELTAALGWSDELEELWVGTKKEGQFVPPSQKKEEDVKKTRDEQLQDEVDKLTKDIDKTLQLGESQKKWLDDHDKKEEFKPTDDAASRTLAPVEKKGLAHIFPFLSSDKKEDKSVL
jgi:NAD-dependent histone deacetylase SIR2